MTSEGTLTLTRPLARFLDVRRATGTYNDKSVRVVGPRIATFVASFGRRPLTQLTRRSIEVWLGSISHLAPASRAAYFASVRQFCRWLCAEHIIERDPTIGIAPPRRPRSVPRAQPRDVIGACYAACRDDRDRLILAFEVGMGLRRGEVAGARWEHYDEPAGILLIRGKGSHERDLPVTAEVRSLLARHPHRRSHGPIVESKLTPGEGILPERVGYIVLGIMRRAGVKHGAYDGVSGHALRHTAASDVLDHCHDLRIVQAMLGHAHLSSTSIYLRRASLAQMREAMEGRDYRAAA
jgi:site-specific recombinase XerC